MRFPKHHLQTVGLLVTFGVAGVVATIASAQTQPPVPSPNASGANGVLVDADGVLRLQHFPDPGGMLVCNAWPKPRPI